MRKVENFQWVSKVWLICKTQFGLANPFFHPLQPFAALSQVRLTVARNANSPNPWTAAALVFLCPFFFFSFCPLQPFPLGPFLLVDRRLSFDFLGFLLFFSLGSP